MVPTFMFVCALHPVFVINVQDNFQEHSYDTKDRASIYFHIERGLKRVTDSTLTLSFIGHSGHLTVKMLKNLSPGLLSGLAMELGVL